MKLYLVRHGESESTGADNERCLSAKGKKDIECLAHFLLPLKLQVSRILQSNKLRAQQTAKILAASIQGVENLETYPELDPLASVLPAMEEISTWKNDILLVGHMPFLGKLVGKSIAKNEDKNIVSFNPGSMLYLEQVEQQWIVRWMLAPELFNHGLDNGK